MSKLNFKILSLFPNYFDPLLSEGVISRAIKNNLISIETFQLRDYSDDKWKNVDESPCGGGDGMVIKPDVVDRALSSICDENDYIIHLSPTGIKFDNALAKTLAQKEKLVFLCGRYAGIDKRVIDKRAHIEVSLGDFVLSGGELAAMCMIDSISRFVDGVLGNKESASHDSFETGLLEAPQYTKPLLFEGVEVPAILLSGDHKKIANFRREESLKLTAEKRPDLLKKIWASLTQKEKSLVENVLKKSTELS